MVRKEIAMNHFQLDCKIRIVIGVTAVLYVLLPMQLVTVIQSIYIVYSIQMTYTVDFLLIHI